MEMEAFGGCSIFADFKEWVLVAWSKTRKRESCFEKF